MNSINMCVITIILFHHNNSIPSYRINNNSNNIFRSKPLASAPESLVHGPTHQDVCALDLTFKPSQVAVTALALPVNLPLSFVAGE